MVFMKKILTVLTISMISLSLFANGSSEKNTKEGNKVINVWSQASEDSREGMMFRKRIDEYNALHTGGYQVELQNITRAGAGSGYVDKLNASLTADTMPEIFTLDGPDVAAYADSGVIQPVNSVLDQSFIDGFTDAMLQEGTVSGQLYALGYQDSAVGIALNRKIVQYLPEDIKALIPSVDEDWSWQDMYEVAKGIQELRENPNTKDIPEIANLDVAMDWLTSDISKGAYETGTYFLTPLLWSNGGQLIGNDGVTLDGYFNSDQNIEALSFMGKFFEDGLVIPVEPTKAFYTEKAGMCIAGFWFIADMINNYPDLDFMTVRYPKYDMDCGSYTPSGSWAFVTSANVDLSTDYGKAVGEVLEMLTNDDAAELYYNDNGAIPGRINKVSVINENTDNQNYNDAWHVFKYEVENTNHARPVTKGYPVLSELWAKDVVLAIGQKGTSDPEEIRAIVNAAMKKIQIDYDRL